MDQNLTLVVLMYFAVVAVSEPRRYELACMKYCFSFLVVDGMERADLSCQKVKDKYCCRETKLQPRKLPVGPCGCCETWFPAFV